MKWLTGFLAAAFLAGMLIAVPSGCGGGKTTEIDTTDKEVEQPAGHKEAYEKSMQRPGNAPSGKK